MNKKIIIVSATLVLFLGLRIWVSATPPPPARESLSSFPKQFGEWTMLQEQVLDAKIGGVLAADDYVMRSYKGSTGVPIDFFVAYYRVQKAGESMHSPKNCLPGWGWQIMKMDRVALNPEDVNNPAMINRYLVEKNGERALVFYWYQANGRMIASEYWGKVYLVWDALRTGRRDGAIVRFVVPVPKGGDPNISINEALKMAKATVPMLPKYLPN